MSQNDKFGVAIHGAGWVAGAHIASWLKNPHAKIVSVSSRRKESAQRLADEHELDCTIHDTYEAALADDRVDIVNLSGPNHVHAEQGIAAAEAGKHILIEKPMVMSIEENRDLRDAVERAGVKSIVSFVLRWIPLFDNIKSLIAAGSIGQPFYVEADYWHGLGDFWTGWDWARQKKYGGSTMLLGGCHACDIIRWITGDEVVEVSAMSNNTTGRMEFDANVVAILKFRSGMIGKTSALFDLQMPYALNVDVAGTEGTLRENRVWSKKLFPGQTDWTTVPTVMPDSGDVAAHPFDAEINEFIDCIREDRESTTNIADAYRSHEMVLAIDRSLEQGGQPVKLPLE